MIKTTAAKVRDYWLENVPFTLSGAVLLLGSLVLVSLSIPNKNVYGITLGTFGVFFLVILTLLIVLQKPTRAAGEIQWHLRNKLRSGMENIGLELGWSGSKAWALFRLKYDITGSVRTRKGPILHFGLRGMLSPDRPSTVPLASPFSGEVDLTARVFLTDIFGLIKTPLRDKVKRSLTILPTPIGLGLEPQKILADGEESQNKFKEADEERYLMREYVAGDRVRDINWKSSFRGGQWFTRISPERKNRSLTIHLVLGLGTGKRDFRSLVHLEILKAWVVGFLTAIFRQEEVQKVIVHHGENSWVLQETGDAETFFYTLATLEAGEDPKAVPEDANPILLFNTLYDHTHLFLHRERPDRKILRWRVGGQADRGIQSVPFWIPPTGHWPDLLFLRPPHEAAPPGPASPNLEVVEALGVRFDGDPLAYYKGGPR
jgi:hypothetical protein